MRMREPLTEDFDYELPPGLIAQHPPAERGTSRMLVLDRATGSIRHQSFRDFPSYLREGDLCVLNDTRVLPARFFSNDGKREVLRLDFTDPLRWRCLVRPGKKFRLGDGVEIGQARGRVEEILPSGERVLAFDQAVDVDGLGHLALPHYMEREDESADRERYQTVYARHEGAIAAPTAGLHFTPDILAKLPHAFLTLHVGVGTFQPVKALRVADHVMHAEHYRLPAETAAALAGAKRVVAIGTTVARVLEHCATRGPWQASEGSTDIFLYPPYQFRAVGALLTNFHLPKSTLLMLISAFAGREAVLQAYASAVREGYRFYSYGDCMLIL